MKKTKDKTTKVKLNTLAKSPNEAVAKKKKNRNKKKNKNKALKNLNGNIEALVSDVTVVAASAVSKKGKMKKNNLDEITCGPHINTSVKDTSSVPKKNKNIDNANDSANILENINIENLCQNSHTPMTEGSLSETVAVSIKDLKENAETPLKDREDINDNVGLSVKDIDKKGENSVTMSVTDVSVISKKRKKKKKKKQQLQQHQQSETGEALIKDIEEMNDNAETPVKDVDETAETSVPAISKKKKKKKRQQQQPSNEETNENIGTPVKDTEEIDEKVENSMNDNPVNVVSTASKNRQPVTKEGASKIQDIEINDNAETLVKDIEFGGDKAEVFMSDMSVTGISVSKKKNKKKKKKTQQDLMTDVPVEDKFKAPKKNKNFINGVGCIDTPESKNIENLDKPMTDISLQDKSTASKKNEGLKQNAETRVKDKDVNGYAEAFVKDTEDTKKKARNSVNDSSATSISISRKRKWQPFNDVTPDSSVVPTNLLSEMSGVPADSSKVDGNQDASDFGSKKKRKKRKAMEMECTTTDIVCDKNKAISKAQPTTKGTNSNADAASYSGRKESEIKMKEKKGPQRNQEEEDRTVFVGNVNTKAKRRDLALLFCKYGKVETVRIRCAAVADPKKSKKETVLTGNYNSLRTSVSAFVRFETKDMMKAALEANGVEFMGKHLRVDSAIPGADQSARYPVFVGNLPFGAEEEELRSFFVDCGEIHSVRIIRDKNFASCLGFGYVNFKSPDSIEFALQLNNKIFMHRQLRVQRCVKKNKKKEKKIRKSQSKKGMGIVNPKKARTENSRPAVDSDFSGMKMMETKEFKKMKKAKGKFSKEDKKKLAVSRKLTGNKPKVKKTT